MARKSKEEILKDVHNRAKVEFDSVQSALRDERLQCLQDRRFYSIPGAQWEGPLGAQFENKPKFEVNKIHLAVIRIINEYRKNRITVTFVPKDGSKGDKLAETCNDLYRADEQDSCAEEAIDNGFEEALGGGFGAVRLRSCYEDEEAEEGPQRIRIEPIFDADSCVFFDLNAKRQDKSDAKKCWVLTSMTYDEYENEYDESPASWPKEVHQNEFDWATPDLVFVAEYYEKEKVKEKYYTYTGLDGESEETYSEDELDEEKLTILEATGFRLKEEPKVKKCIKVHKYIMSGNGILEDCGFIAGKNIPVAPVYGKRWYVDNIERCMGHVRLAKDAMRLANMQRSKLAEISALSAVEKPILTPEQVAGHAHMWAEDNVKNWPYLLINAMKDFEGNPVAAGPIGYTKPPQIPPAMAALLQITEQDIKDLLGNQESGEQIQSNTSGVLMELVQNKLDMQSFIYISNLAKAVKRIGEIWLSMAKEIYVEEGRKMKTIDKNGEPGNIELSKPLANPETGETEYENDLTKASFDVNVEVGPTSSSKRGATVRNVTAMMGVTQDPETLQVLGSLAMMNMEGEGIGDVRSYFRKKLVRMGVVKPNEEEEQQLAEEQANAQPDPQSAYLLAEAQKSQADTALIAAKTEKTKAEVAEILAGIDNAKREQVLKAIDTAMGVAEAGQLQGA